MRRDVRLSLPLALGGLASAISCGGEMPVGIGEVSADPGAGQSLELRCIDPAVAGAFPDDGLDDRQPIQSILDANPLGVSICLRPGRYELTRRGGTTHRRASSLSIESSNVQISGAGWGTELALVGSGANSDWNGIEIKSAPPASTPVSGVSIQDLFINAEDSFDRREQTHLISVGAGFSGDAQVSDVQISRVAFYMPQVVGEGGGDCVRILGGPTRPVARVQVSDNQFLACDRSSISVQRGTGEVVVDGNLFAQVGDQHIDFEPTGKGGVDRYVITSNVFAGGAQGKIHVSIMGNSDVEPAADVLFASNVLVGRGLLLMNARRAVITGNLIGAEMNTTSGVLNAIKVQDSLVISNNILRRWGQPGSVVTLMHHGSGAPGQLLVTGNQFIQESAGTMFYAESAQDLTISSNVFQYLGPPGESPAAIKLRATTRPADRLLVLGNRVRTSGAPLTAFLRLGAAPFSVGAVSAVGNLTEGAAIGLVCEGTGGFTRPIVHSANYYDGARSATSGCASRATVVAQYP
jgi:Right handed beta helix region